MPNSVVTNKSATYSRDILTDLSKLYQSANIHQKQAFIRMVFNSSIIYAIGIYRTPSILPLFADKLLILKEKRLLEIQQPLENSRVTPVSAPGGT